MGQLIEPFFCSTRHLQRGCLSDSHHEVPVTHVRQCPGGQGCLLGLSGNRTILTIRTDNQTFSEELLHHCLAPLPSFQVSQVTEVKKVTKQCTQCMHSLRQRVS